MDNAGADFIFCNWNMSRRVLSRWILTPSDSATVGFKICGCLIKAVSESVVRVDNTKRCRVIRNRMVRPGDYVYCKVEVSPSQCI